MSNAEEPMKFPKGKYPQVWLDMAYEKMQSDDPNEVLTLLGFGDAETEDIFLFKFDLFTRLFFERFFTSENAPFHDQMILNMRRSYFGETKYLNLGFRGCSKTSLTKLFLTYVLLNDALKRKKYIKVMTRNLPNAKQMVTDIYNYCVEVKDLYGDIFVKEGDKKREETMGGFTTVDQRKLLAGTIGITQRGHLQDAYRPDWLCHAKGTFIFDEGEWMPVEDHPGFLGVRKENGLEVKLNSLPHTETVTKEHQYWAKHIIKNRFQKSEDIGDGWVEAQHLTKKHYIGLPIDQSVVPLTELLTYHPSITRNTKGQVAKTESGLQKKFISELLDTEWWWFFGLFWGDGNLGSKKSKGRNSSNIFITVANAQPHILQRVIRLIESSGRRYRVIPKVGCCQIVFSHAVLARFLRTWYIGGNSQKRPPQEVEYIEHHYQEALVRGYIDADGFIDHQNKAVRVTSVSLNGLYALRRILARLGIASSIRNGVKAHIGIINGMTCNIQNKYDLRFAEGLGYTFPRTNRYAYARTFIQDGYLWTKVQHVTPSEETEFVPITTTDHTYLTHFGKSHNCFDDVEDRESIQSLAQTESTIFRIDEAIAGLSATGTWMCNGNYISEEGVIQWFLNKPDVVVDKIPILDEDGNPTWPERYNKEKIESIKNDAEDFYGEYMNDPSRADTAFFDRQMVDQDIASVKQPSFESAGVKYWTEYQPHHMYGIGADTSEGIGKDANTFALFDFGTFPDDVAVLGATYYNNRIAPDLFGHELMRVGREFGNCIIAPEANNTGHSTIAAMRGYPNIYSERKEGTRTLKVTDRLGWRTTKKSKPAMFFEFRKDYNDGKIKIYDINVLKEMRSYTTSDVQDVQVGMVTRHFDLLMAVVIGYQMKKYTSHTTYDESELPQEDFLFEDIGI